MPPKRFIDEAITPSVENCDTLWMAPGEPCLPREFTWRGNKVVVTELLRQWREVGPCHHGSGEMYARKHWYEVATSEGVMEIYFERQPRKGAAHKHKKERWWLFSISS